MADDGGRRGKVNWPAIGAIAAIAGVIAAVLIAVLSGGGKSGPPTTSTEPPTTTTGTTNTDTGTSSVPVAAAPTKVCVGEISLEEDASYSLNECKADREGTVGFEPHGKAFETVGGAKVARWTSAHAPSASDCVTAVGASGEESVKLTSPGQWLCAEGAEHHVLRIRFDSYRPPPSVVEGGLYRFYVDVYETREG